ncbi:MAG: host-nuclease inhibitor Gam family protein [Candidatus Hydrothermarchaeales archaeon]
MAQRIKGDSINVPQTRDEVAEAIQRIGDLQRTRQRVQADMNDELSRVKAKYEAMVEPVNLNLKALFAGVRAWCEANRQEIMPKRGKTVVFPSGEIQWRITPPRMAVRGVEKVLEVLKSMGLTRFIRTKDEIDKEAMLKEREAVENIKGITVSQKEEFIVKPFETELEEVA